MTTGQYMRMLLEKDEPGFMSLYIYKLSMALYYFAAAVLRCDVRLRQFRGQFVRQYF